MVLLLLGCASGWLDATPACDANPYDWADDLLTHVLNGDGEGAFDYDPVDTPRTKIAGSYDVNSGDFSWDVSFDERYHRASQSYVGDGTVYHNGDLDLQMIVTTTDILDVADTANNRYIREGCGTQSWSWVEDESPDDAMLITGVYKSDGYTWSAENDDWSYDGSQAPDLTETTHYVAKDGSWEQETVSSPDGTAAQDFVGDETCADPYSCDGHVDFAFDGGYTYTQHILDGDKVECTLTGDYDYAGDGTTHYECTDYTCELETVDGVCKYTCDNGQKGDC